MTLKEQLNNYINTHKYQIAITVVAVVAICMIRNQNIQWVDYRMPQDDVFGYVTAG